MACPRFTLACIDLGYPYMLMPDHAPSHPDDKAISGASDRATAGWSFQFGCT
jgi:hypothetical protein